MTRSNILPTLGLFLALVLHVSPARASDNLEIAGILQDHMVLQQGMKFSFWGQAIPGAGVQLRTGWDGREYTTIASSDSSWKIDLQVPMAQPGKNHGYKVGICSGTDTIILDDVMIGEVWLCSGQSNMNMTMQAFPPWHEGVLDRESEIEAADHPLIRFFTAENRYEADPVEFISGRWEVCSPETAGEFSGVAYYFSRRVQAELDIPVGILVSSKGGASCQAYTRKEILQGDQVLKEKYYDPYKSAPENYVPELRPCLLYNATIHPLLNYSIRGVLWYQGESNASDHRYYRRLNEAMIRDWREGFGRKDMPFYFVQMTPYNWGNEDPYLDNYALFRETQARISQMDHCGMIVSMDVGEPENIHPRDKSSIGERLAAMAMELQYGIKNPGWQGPVYDRFRIKKEAIRVIFKKSTVGSGLKTNDGKPARHFYIAGEDQIFHLAHVEIQENSVLLWSEKVTDPLAVRYAFTNAALTNFGNAEGLPLMPFRTDQWEDAHYYR